MSQYKKDMIASFFFLILGALVLISVPLTIQDPGVSVMGPRVFPYFIGACMVILSLALMLTTIVKHRKAGGADSTGTFASTVILLIFRVKKIWAYPVVYAAAVAIWAGFTFLLSVRLP